MVAKWVVKDFDSLSLEELYEVMHLRQVVFVVEQDCPYIDADGKDFFGQHVLGYNDGDKLIAYTRILPAGISYPKEPAIGRVVSHPDVRGKGVGRPLMQKSIEVLEETYGNSACRISAQTYLLNYYREFGFEAVGEEYLEDGLPHFEMLRP